MRRSHGEPTGRGAVGPAGDGRASIRRQRRPAAAPSPHHRTLHPADGSVGHDHGEQRPLGAVLEHRLQRAVVALAFIGQVADVGQPFFLFALAVLPTLFLLGLLTYLRLAQSASEDLLYSRAINRIRRYYLDLDPAAPSWFLLGGHDDIHGVMANMGLVPSNWHLLSHTSTMVAVTTSMIGGAFVAVAVGGARRRPGPGGRRRSGRGAGQPHPGRGTVARPGPAVAHRRAERAVCFPVHARPWVTEPANGCLVPRRRRGRSRQGRPTKRKGPLT